MRRYARTRGLGDRFYTSFRRILRRHPVCSECGRLIRGRRVRRLGGLCYRCARPGWGAQKGEIL